MKDAIKLNNSLLKFTGTIFTKSKKICDLYTFIEILKDDPLALMKAKGKISRKHECFEILRTFNQLDETSIFIESFNGLKPFIMFDSFHFRRSFENLKEFEISGLPNSTYVAVLINRSV